MVNEIVVIFASKYAQNLSPKLNIIPKSERNEVYNWVGYVGSVLKRADRLVRWYNGY